MPWQAAQAAALAWPAVASPGLVGTASSLASSAAGPELADEAGVALLDGAAGLAAVAFIGVLTGAPEGGFASRGVFGASVFELVVREGVLDAGGLAGIWAKATPARASMATEASTCRKLIHSSPTGTVGAPRAPRRNRGIISAPLKVVKHVVPARNGPDPVTPQRQAQRTRHASKHATESPAQRALRAGRARNPATARRCGRRGRLRRRVQRGQVQCVECAGGRSEEHTSELQ